MNQYNKYKHDVLKYSYVCVCVPVVYVVQPVQQRVDVSDLQLVVGDGLQSPSNRLVVALHINLRRSKVEDKEEHCYESLVLIVCAEMKSEDHECLQQIPQ